ncbi:MULTISPECIES: M20 family metallo-hydrolase [Cytobacillus]|uniref:Zn-dependent hydrolase n=2 Tax=Cytobacillus TaxID=2675230 RepID=A0ABX3CPD6_9BACI|nr:MULTISPECIES: M20 family metallo-hydrolase [Cytobacillus]MBU8732244.1 M20 family metallo-hydrolase [Cytobacillus oceanisediminis]MCM3404582.1 M20 family metallo-hydrolase [Cytobacillus oceanisediminis]MDK7666193.1 M20 family metallo-hydrolase [Cytobacillus oceanisediminis]OHX45601.1 Zn-dependent hydrolase [Cytobacillus oceanisediminis]QOK28956.1 M20 family metallo-hydrolase [Cytobacillus oceanisediminis]
METTKLMVNRKRLLDTINVSSSIGALENGGLNRLALTEEDKKMRNIFVKWLQEEKLDVRVDDLGNIYGRRKGKFNDSPAVAIGSHLDTQPCGGRFDGILGVLTALEVVRTLNENNIETDYPIEIVNFTNEEGARFEPPMLGSGGVAGEFTTDFIYNTKDNENISFQEALKKIQYMGDEKHRLRDIKYFIELHVEQGPILEKNNKLIGIVEGIQGISWLNVKVVGETNHAGPTPMEDRKDALAPSAKMVTKVYEITNEIEGLKTTVGKLNVKPNITNVIPGEVEFMIDVRHKDDEIRAGTIDRLREQLGTIAVMNNVEVTISTDWNSDAVLFSSEVMDAISEAAGVLGYSTLRLFSGPGHDAKYISKMADTGMIFLPSINGISHNEKELTLEDDIEKGANVLLNTILKLARAH